MRFIDLKTQYEKMEVEIHSSINSVLNHGQYIMGPEVGILERELSEFVNCKYSLTCSSGTDALLMPLMAYGIGPGDAVFTTPFTFIATAEVIKLVGATPIFVDIEEKTFNICPKKLEEKINNIISKGDLTPKAVISVDLFGLPANQIKIAELAKNFDLKLVVDSAQGFGAKINGKISCGMGNVGATSFFPAKPLGGYGDGGAIFTNDKELYKKLISIRNHGEGENKYENTRIGLNGRLDSIQAAILLVKLKYYKEEIRKRNRVAKKYKEGISSNIISQYVPNKYESVWAQYSILAFNNEQRQLIMKKLKENNVPTAIYYPKPLHLQTAFNTLGYKKGDFPVTENISNRIFSIPMHPYIKDEDIENIISIINEF